MGSILCEHCAAACCRYVAIPLDKPTSAKDYDDIRWYLMHENISVFVEEGDWYFQVTTRCKNLGADNRCGVYETRPQICRDYKAGDCDYAGGTYGYDHLFTHPKQIEAYYAQRTGKELGRPKESAARTRTRRKTKKSA
jgi:Fe-S-cluster containining protein